MSPQLWHGCCGDAGGNDIALAPISGLPLCLFFSLSLSLSLSLFLSDVSLSLSSLSRFLSPSFFPSLFFEGQAWRCHARLWHGCGGDIGGNDIDPTADIWSLFVFLVPLSLSFASLSLSLSLFLSLPGLTCARALSLVLSDSTLLLSLLSSLSFFRALSFSLFLFSLSLSLISLSFSMRRSRKTWIGLKTPL